MCLLLKTLRPSLPDGIIQVEAGKTSIALSANHGGNLKTGNQKGQNSMTKHNSNQENTTTKAV